MRYARGNSLSSKMGIVGMLGKVSTYSQRRVTRPPSLMVGLPPLCRAPPVNSQPVAGLSQLERFDLEVFVQSELAEFAAVAGLFESAEGRKRVEFAAVNIDLPGA